MRAASSSSTEPCVCAKEPVKGGPVKQVVPVGQAGALTSEQCGKKNSRESQGKQRSLSKHSKGEKKAECKAVRMALVAKESPARREADVLTSKKCGKEGKVSQDTKCSPNQHSKGVRKEAVRRSASGESRDRGEGNEFVPPIPMKSNTDDTKKQEAPVRKAPVAKESPARREADVLTSKKCSKE